MMLLGFLLGVIVTRVLDDRLWSRGPRIEEMSECERMRAEYRRALEVQRREFEKVIEHMRLGRGEKKDGT